MSKLLPYTTYQPVHYDYVSQLPDGWKLLPNIAIFKERKEKGGLEMESLSVSAIKGIVKAADYEDRKDRTSDDKSEYLVVHEGDIPYNTMLMWAGAVGRSEYEGIVSPAYTVLQPKSKVEINTKYFHYMFRSQFYKDYSKRFSYGIVDSRLRLYYTYFKRMYSIVPPFETQNAIVAYLDRKTQQIQEFITKKERLIELLEEQLKCKINDALTKGIYENVEFKSIDLTEIEQIPKHWKFKKFKWITSIISCGIASTPEYVDEDKGVAFLSAQNCRPFRMDLEKYNFISPKLHKQLTQNKKPEKGDVLVTRVGAGIGDACIIDIDLEFSIYVSLTHIRPTKEILNEYVVYFFQTYYCDRLNFNSTVEAGGQGNLNVKNVEKYRIPLPPINEQKEICSFLNNSREQVSYAIAKAQSEIEKAKEYQESLITQVVTGQLKVPVKANANWGKNIELGMVAEPNVAYHSKH